MRLITVNHHRFFLFTEVLNKRKTTCLFLRTYVATYRTCKSVMEGGEKRALTPACRIGGGWLSSLCLTQFSHPSGGISSSAAVPQEAVESLEGNQTLLPVIHLTPAIPQILPYHAASVSFPAINLLTSVSILPSFPGRSHCNPLQ